MITTVRLRSSASSLFESVITGNEVDAKSIPSCRSHRSRLVIGFVYLQPRGFRGQIVALYSESGSPVSRLRRQITSTNNYHEVVVGFDPNGLRDVTDHDRRSNKTTRAQRIPLVVELLEYPLVSATKRPQGYFSFFGSFGNLFRKHWHRPSVR